MDNETLSELPRMQSGLARPIFVVGSPRSGTSVLAWCLGQHPNIFPVPESNWMGDFAVNVAISYEVGAARGNLSILSAMEITRAGFFANFGQSINDLILAHRAVLEQKRKLDTSSTRKHTSVGSKARWVDGTPEYSLHICGLRKLFPGALFIHLVRDVDAVVRSLLNFHRISGIHLVANEEVAYDHWLRRVKACLKAEQAYGPHVVRRMSYSTLVENPELAMQSLLSFVGEPYSARCLEPLSERINSSNVPSDFKSDDPATDPAIVEKARRLWIEIEGTAQPKEPSTAAADELEIEFQKLYLGTGKIEHELTNQTARQEQPCKNRLAKRLREMQQLVTILDEFATIAASLRSSRFWRFANRVAATEAKLVHNKEFVPDRAFRKVLARYSKWRASHPRIANPDGSPAGESPVAVKRFEAVPENQAIRKESANA